MKTILTLIAILALSICVEAKTTKPIAKPSPTPTITDVQEYWTALYSKLDTQADTLTSQKEEIDTLKTQNATLVEENKTAIAATEEVRQIDIKKDKTILEQAATINTQADTIKHKSNFINMCANIIAFLVSIGVGLGIFKITQNMAEPWYKFGIPIASAFVAYGIVWASITFYASHIA